MQNIDDVLQGLLSLSIAGVNRPPTALPHVGVPQSGFFLGTSAVSSSGSGRVNVEPPDVS